MCIEEGEENKEDKEVDKNGRVSHNQIEKVAYNYAKESRIFLQAIGAIKRLKQWRIVSKYAM